MVWNEAINFPHSVGFNIGADLVCLSENTLGKHVLVNSYPSVLDNGLISFVCQQDQTLELAGTEVALLFNNEVVGEKGKPVSSSLCEVHPYRCTCIHVHVLAYTTVHLGPSIIVHALK